MSKKPGFYAVRIGRQPGVYTTWADAEAQVKGFAGAQHKKFMSEPEAKKYTYGAGNQGPTTVGYAPAPSTSKRALWKDESEPPERAAKKRHVTVEAVADVPPGVAGTTSNLARKVYCDGSCHGNGGGSPVAGIGVYWPKKSGGGAFTISEHLPGDKPTNNRAELYAVARALESDPHPDQKLEMCLDSQYVISVFSKWIDNWRRKDWKTSTGGTVLNVDLIQYISSLLELRPASGRITFKWEKGHAGNHGNEMADQLANAGVARPKPFEPDWKALTVVNQNKLVDGREAKAAKAQLSTDEQLAAIYRNGGVSSSRSRQPVKQESLVEIDVPEEFLLSAAEMEREVYE